MVSLHGQAEDWADFSSDATRIEVCPAAARCAQASELSVSLRRVDWVLLDGDPSAEISAVRNATLVIKGRVAYALAQLHHAMGIRPSHRQPCLRCGGRPAVERIRARHGFNTG